MTPSKIVTGIALATTLLAGPALAEATTLRIAHVWPGGSLIDRELFQAWAESVEEASDGRLQVEIFPGATLTGADNAYQGVVNGIADVGATAQGSCILQSLYEQGHFDEEYSDTRPLFMFTTGPGYLHTKERLIKTPADLEGLRLRRPTPVVGDMFTRLGAQAVGMPAPEVFTSMQRGVVDGLSFNWEGMKTFRLNELASYHTEVPLYDLSLFATMNQRTYDSLPEDLQQVIDDHSGLEWSLRASEVYDELIRQGRQDAEEAGHEFLVIEDALEHADWGPVLNETIERYLDEIGEEGRVIYEAAIALQAECRV